MKKYSIQKIQCFMMLGSIDTNCLGLRAPYTTAISNRNNDLQPQPNIPCLGSKNHNHDLQVTVAVDQNFQIYVANTRIFRYLLAISEFSDICWQYQNFLFFQHGTAIQLRKIKQINCDVRRQAPAATTIRLQVAVTVENRFCTRIYMHLFVE